MAAFDEHAAGIDKIYIEGKYEQLLSTIDLAKRCTVRSTMSRAAVQSATSLKSAALGYPIAANLCADA